MKYLNNFESYSAYKTALNNGEIATPSVSLVEGKCYYKPIVKTNFGDVAMYNKVTGDFEFCSLSAYKSEVYRDLTRKPIGVVVVPSAYTPDNTNRVMSLKNMSCKSPSTGSVSTLVSSNVVDNCDGDLNMKWGASGNIANLPNYPSVVKVNPLTGEETGTIDWMRIPSDRAWNASGYIDPITGYRYYFNNYINDPNSASGDKEDRFGPYPLLADGSKSPLYFRSGMATNDFNGKENTAAILASATVDYTRLETIEATNTSTGYYPAAFCCARYSTIGTNPGDWYLPAQGEASFMIAKYGMIYDTTLWLEQNLPGESIRLGRGGADYGNWFWCSSSHSSTTARTVYLSSGYVSYGSRSNVYTDNRVRAFLAL